MSKEKARFYLCLRVLAVLTIVFAASMAAAAGADRKPGLRVLPLQAGEIKNLGALAKLPTAVQSSKNAFLWTIHGWHAQAAPHPLLKQKDSGDKQLFKAYSVEPIVNAYAFMIDDSRSMDKHWKNAVPAVRTIWQILPHDAMAALYSFSEKPTMKRPFRPTSGAGDLLAPLDKFETKGLQTAIYGAMLKVFDDLAEIPAVNRHVIIFTDGDAEDKAPSLKDVLEEARRRDILVHTVGFTQGRPRDALNSEVIDRLSEETGGVRVFYESQEALADAFEEEFASHFTAGIVHVENVEGVPWGLESVTMQFIHAAGGSEPVELKEDLPLTGAKTFDNLLVSINKATGMNAWLAIGLTALLLVLLVSLLVFLVLRARKKRRQAEEARLARLKGEQQVKMQQMEQDLTAKLPAPKTKAFSQGHNTPVLGPTTPYGWLVSSDGAKYPLIMHATRIGREKGNDVVLPDTNVSRDHATLELKDGVFVWTDKSPTNPTVINGQEVKGSLTIDPGAALQIGGTALIFQLA